MAFVNALLATVTSLFIAASVAPVARPQRVRVRRRERRPLEISKRQDWLFY